MTAGPVSFDVGSLVDARAILRELGERFPTRRLGAEQLSEVYLDTFDWRIYRDGGTLAAVESDGRRLLYWRDLDGRLRHRSPYADEAFAWDLAPTPLGRALARLLSVRRLLPRVSVDLERQGVSVLDGNQKTVARVSLDRATVYAPGERNEQPVPLQSRLRVESVLGYDSAHEAVCRAIDAHGAATRARVDDLTLALGVLGRRPADYSSRLELQIDPAERAVDAARRILRALLDTMRRNEQGTLEDLDSEFLHDFRVSVRRTRAALAQIKGVFPPEELAWFREEFSWLGRTTGPTRDLDVFLLKLRGYAEAFPEPVRRELAVLAEFLEQRQREEQRALAQALRSSRYRTLIRKWARFLDRAQTPSPAPPHALRPVVDVADARIWRLFRRVLRDGQEVCQTHEAERMHELRIDCKKLRYMLEFFRSLHDEERIGPPVRTLKKLQDHLGDYNDLVVQQGALARYAEQLHGAGRATIATLLAIGRLIEWLDGQRRAEADRFGERWASFADAGSRREFQALFKERTPG